MAEPGKPPWRVVALPAEHGGWGFVLEPILLGLLVAPSSAGFFLALIALASFLARTPLKILWKDVRRSRRYARTTAAAQVLLLYGGLAGLGFAGALLSGGWWPLLPLLLVSPLIALQLYFDLYLSSRNLLPELAGPVALAAVAAGMGLANGWLWPAAFGLWAIMVLRGLPSILYVRARLRLEKGQPVNPLPVITVQFAAWAVGLSLFFLDVLPFLAVTALLILLARAVWGLSAYRRPVVAKTIGWGEILFGLLTVLLSAIGYWL